MFEIHVVSDPPASLQLGSLLSDYDLETVAAYDENLVKPALLFADKVTLTSYRQDVGNLILAAAFSNTQMPIRYMMAFAYMVLRDDPEEIEGLGLDRSKFCSKEEARKAIHPTSSTTKGAILQLGEKYAEGILEYQYAVGKRLKSRNEKLASPGLELAINRGLLDYEGWLQRDDMTPFYLNWKEGIEACSHAARLSVIERLTTSHGVPLIDPGARAVLSSAERGSPIHEVVSSYQSNLHYGDRLAAVMDAGLPYLQDMPLDEIIDLRESLADYLPAFRNAILELSENIKMGDGLGAREIGREVSLAWTRQIEPALQEIRQEVKRARYPRQVLSSFSRDVSALAGIGAVVLAAGSTFAGLGALIPAAAAAAYPFVHALNEKLKASEEIKKNRLFFLYDLERRARKRSR